MEVELSKDIAQKLGLKTVNWFNVTNFSNIYSPAPKPYDFAIAEVTITPARAKNVAFSVPYYNANQGILIRKGLTPQPKSIADLQKLQLCAQIGTTGADYITSKIHPTKAPLLPADDDDRCSSRCESGRCDAAIFDGADPRRPEGDEAERLRPDRRPDRDRTSSTASSSRRASTLLTAASTTALKGLIADGTVSKLAKKYLTTDVSKLPIFK